MSFRYTLLTDGAQPPRRAHPGDAGFDLCAAESVRLEPGDRIAQLVIVAIGDDDPEEAEALAESARGEGGFGSTGRR